jgi:UDP-N-acetyl-D-galactosamine dehydrogenase
LGYVGLPVALSISKKFNTIGFDTNYKRIKQLKNKFDKNKEYTKKDFYKKKIKFSNNFNAIKNCNFYIICVPTPISKTNLPDLSSIKKSISLISKFLKKNDVIVLESTVYPGVTQICSNYLENKTNLKNNKDFFMCYSPERINPGDKSKKIFKIDKIFAINSSNKKLLLNIRNIYKLISKKIIFSRNIKEAEAAKAIENTQRDLNIALFNELLILSNKLNLKFNEIIRLASSKWNFLKFKPGLVGGHCLPVDPYYLSYISSKNGFKTRTLLAGRYTNNFMSKYVIDLILKLIKKNKFKKNIKILIAGITYKYAVSDIRNSLNLKIFNEIKKKYKNTKIYDPFIKIPNQINNIDKLKNLKIIVFLSNGKKYKNLYLKAKRSKVFLLDPFNYYS